MATHSSVLAWGRKESDRLSHATFTFLLVERIPLTEEPGSLQSIESQRAGHD